MEHKFKIGDLVKHFHIKYDNYSFYIIGKDVGNGYFVLDKNSVFPGSSECTDLDRIKYQINIKYIGKRVIAWFYERELILFEKKYCSICQNRKILDKLANNIPIKKDVLND